MEKYIKLYDTVIKNNYSIRSGAYSVVDQNIKMELDEYGEYTSIMAAADLNSYKIAELMKVCAMSDESLNESQIGEELFGQIENIKRNPALGFYKSLYAGHVIEGDYRKNASSGGIATWLLVQLLNKGLIDGVVHVKASDDGDGVLFKYAISSTVKDIITGSKSRYYPAEFSDALNTIKSAGGKYAVVGIPSFITEVRLLAKEDSQFNESIKYTIGLICGHQKSTKYAEALAWQHGIKPGDLKSIDFRKKVEGQPASRYITEFTGLVNGELTTITKEQHELFVSNWGHGFFKTQMSDFTDDAMNETADISLGDAWLPEYTKDSRGNNILIIRNNDIQKIIQDGAKNGLIQIDELNEQSLVQSQSGLIHHTQDELPYRLYKKDKKNQWRPKKRYEASRNLTFTRKRVQDLRQRISMISHTTYREAVKRDDWYYFFNRMRPYVYVYVVIYLFIQSSGKNPLWVVSKILNKVFK